MFDGELPPYGRRGRKESLASGAPGHDESTTKSAAAGVAGRRRAGVWNPFAPVGVWGSISPHRPSERVLEVGAEVAGGTTSSRAAVGRRWPEAVGRTGGRKGGGSGCCVVSLGLEYFSYL